MSLRALHEAHLIGYLDLVGQPMAFVLPLFEAKERDNSLWCQELNAQGVIIGFRQVVAPQVHITLLRDGLVARIGEEGCWGFKWSAHDVAVEREGNLRTVLLAKETLKLTPSSPLLHLQVIDFCHLNEQRPQAVITAYQSLKRVSNKCADMWRDDQIIGPATRRALARLETATVLSPELAASLSDISYKVERQYVRLSLPEDLVDRVKEDKDIFADLAREIENLGLRLVFENARDVLVREVTAWWKAARRSPGKGRTDDLVNSVVVKVLSEASGKPRYLSNQEWFDALLHRSSQADRYRVSRHRDIQSGHRDSLSRRDIVDPAQEFKVRYLEVQSAISKLPQLQKEALILVNASGFSYSEAALITETSAATVRRRVRRALINLRKIMGLKENEIG